jgi:hypothetical protein
LFVVSVFALSLLINLEMINPIQFFFKSIEISISYFFYILLISPHREKKLILYDISIFFMLFKFSLISKKIEMDLSFQGL